MRKILATLCLAMMPGLATAQSATTALGADLRVLDKLNGIVTDVSLRAGETATLGYLSVNLKECRFPRDNPNGDAFAELLVMYRDNETPAFEGWLIASAPALNAMEHPRYDVWVLRCIRS
ncbi:MAG: DUF2155 domain-containing protein [Pseudomonadota bacterium]